MNIFELLIFRIPWKYNKKIICWYYVTKSVVQSILLLTFKMSMQYYQEKVKSDSSRRILERNWYHHCLLLRYIIKNRHGICIISKGSQHNVKEGKWENTPFSCAREMAFSLVSHPQWMTKDFAISLFFCQEWFQIS